MKNLNPDVKITLVQTPQSASKLDPATGSVNMTGYDGVMFIATIGDVVTGGQFAVKAQASDTNTSVDFKDLPGTTLTAAISEKEKVMIIDIYRPLEQFVRAKINRNIQNIATGGVIAIQYQSGHKPTANDTATVAAEVLVISPS